MLGISSWSLESREENMKSCSVSPFYCLNWVPGNCCQLLLPLLTTSYHCHCQSKTLHHNMNLSVWQQPKQCPVSWLFEIWFVALWKAMFMRPQTPLRHSDGSDLFVRAHSRPTSQESSPWMVRNQGKGCRVLKEHWPRTTPWLGIGCVYDLFPDILIIDSTAGK